MTKAKRTRRPTTTKKQERVLKNLVIGIACATPINIIFSGMAVFGYALKNSMNGGPLFFAIVIYGLALPFIARFSIRAGIRSKKGALSSRTLSYINAVGSVFVLGPTLLIGISLALAPLAGTVLVDTVYPIFLLLYPLGGIMLFINMFLALPPSDETKQR